MQFLPDSDDKLITRLNFQYCCTSSSVFIFTCIFVTIWDRRSPAPKSQVTFQNGILTIKTNKRMKQVKQSKAKQKLSSQCNSIQFSSHYHKLESVNIHITQWFNTSLHIRYFYSHILIRYKIISYYHTHIIYLQEISFYLFLSRKVHCHFLSPQCLSSKTIFYHFVE